MLVRYNGADYAYQHNLQGDILSLVDMDGTAVVKYAYDAWGKPISTAGSMAETLGHDNPFRYRGYVWDEETGLYYLRSRYYEPSWGRFVNADTLVGHLANLGSHNLFAYCKNNPVVSLDSDGQEPLSQSTDEMVIRAVPQLSPEDHDALVEAGFYIPERYQLMNAHDVSSDTRCVTLISSKEKPTKYFLSTSIVLEEAHIIETEYTYTYRREYDSTFRSRYEKSRVSNAAVYDAIGFVDISSIPASIPALRALDLTRTVTFTLLDNFVKLLPYPKDPKKIIYRKVSERVQQYRKKKRRY